MKFSVLESTSPYLNLAIEEYLLKYCEGEYFLLWQNEPTVVIGKNQNVFAEVNIEYAKEKGINIARRISGGGAVYHDFGNLNFSYISDKEEEGIDFKRFTTPIINALKKMGLSPELSGRNDILISGKKISGNAQTHFDNRVLHHGTLLYNSDANILSEVLNVDKEKLKAKAIASVKSRITNIKEFLNFDCSFFQFINLIKNHIISEYNTAEFKIVQNDTIKKLEERNRSESWIFPNNEFLSSLTFAVKKRYVFGCVAVDIKLNNDSISDIKISGDFFGAKDVSNFEKELIGVPFSRIPEKIEHIKISDYILGMTNQEFLDLLNE